MSAVYFSPNMRRALTQQFLVSLIRELLQARGAPALSIARLTAYLTTHHPRISTPQIAGAIRVGIALQQFVLSPDGMHLNRFVS